MLMNIKNIKCFYKSTYRVKPELRSLLLIIILTSVVITGPGCSLLNGSFPGGIRYESKVSFYDGRTVPPTRLSEGPAPFVGVDGLATGIPGPGSTGTVTWIVGTTNPRGIYDEPNAKTEMNWTLGMVYGPRYPGCGASIPYYVRVSGFIWTNDCRVISIP